MGGKIFLNRNLKKSSSSVYYRYFLWAAIGLVILVVITPLITHRRSDKATSKKVTPENGMVVREIPKSSPLDSTGNPASQESTPIETIKEANLEPGSAVSNNPPQAEEKVQPSEEVQPSNDAERPSGVGEAPQGADSTAQSQEASISGQQPAVTPEAPSPTASNQVAMPPAATPTATPQESTPTESALPQQAAASSPPEQQAAPLPPPVETSPSPVKPAVSQGTRYIVQIGSFTQRQNADNIQQSLLQKGYEVVVRTINHAKFGKLYVVQLASVNDARKAESLMARVRKEANVKPMLVKVPAGQ